MDPSENPLVCVVTTEIRERTIFLIGLVDHFRSRKMLVTLETIVNLWLGVALLQKTLHDFLLLFSQFRSRKLHVECDVEHTANVVVSQ